MNLDFCFDLRTHENDDFWTKWNSINFRVVVSCKCRLTRFRWRIVAEELIGLSADFLPGEMYIAGFGVTRANGEAQDEQTVDFRRHNVDLTRVVDHLQKSFVQTRVALNETSSIRALHFMSLVIPNLLRIDFIADCHFKSWQLMLSSSL